MAPPDASPEDGAKPVDLRGARNTAISMAVAALVVWAIMGPDNPFLGMTVTLCTANLGLAVIPLAVRIPARWYHVPRAERWLHYLLAVPAFGWLLDRSGWNRKVALPMRQLRISRTSLPRLLEYIHAAEGAHAIAFLPHAALTALLFATGHEAGAWWILVPGIVLHFYPVLLQRWMTLRVAPMVRRKR
jgi:hypothetical protein